MRVERTERFPRAGSNFDVILLLVPYVLNSMFKNTAAKWSLPETWFEISLAY